MGRSTMELIGSILAAFLLFFIFILPIMFIIGGLFNKVTKVALKKDD